MYRHQVQGFNSTSLEISFSNSVVNSILYGGANLVPIAVPHICFKVFLPKVKTLFSSTTSASSTNIEVLTFFSLSLTPIFFVEQTDPRHVEY